MRQEVSAQRKLIFKVSDALKPGGRFLFTAPRDTSTWMDVLTGHPSQSLGAAGYEAIITAAGLAVVDEYLDDGDNHYFDARK